MHPLSLQVGRSWHKRRGVIIFITPGVAAIMLWSDLGLVLRQVSRAEVASGSLSDHGVGVDGNDVPDRLGSLRAERPLFGRSLFHFKKVFIF